MSETESNVESEAARRADFRGRLDDLFDLFMNMIRWVYQEIPPVGTKPMAYSTNVTLEEWLVEHGLLKAYRREAAIVTDQMALDHEMADVIDDFLSVRLPSISLAAVKTFIAMDHQPSRYRFFLYLISHSSFLADQARSS